MFPLQAVAVKSNGWKIEPSSTALTTITTSKTTVIKSPNDYIDVTYKLMNYSDKLSFNSEKEINRSDFKIYIRDYIEKAGTAPIRLTYIILDEVDSQTRFVFTMNSIGIGDSYLEDSIVNTFKRN